MNSLIDLLNQYPNKQACIDHPVKTRWPKGITCPRCESPKTYTCKKKFRCGTCKRDFSVRTGTIYEGSPLPFRKWFSAMWLLSSSPKGISSCQLAREIGVTQNKDGFQNLTIAVEEATLSLSIISTSVSTVLSGLRLNTIAFV